MMQEHTNASQKLKSLAKDRQIPEMLDQPHAQMVQKLAAASEKELPRAYLTMQVQAHQESVALFERYAQNGNDAELKAFTQQTLPLLREHLQAAQKLQTSMS